MERRRDGFRGSAGEKSSPTDGRASWGRPDTPDRRLAEKLARSAHVPAGGGRRNAPPPPPAGERLEDFEDVLNEMGIGVASTSTSASAAPDHHADPSPLPPGDGREEEEGGDEDEEEPDIPAYVAREVFPAGGGDRGWRPPARAPGRRVAVPPKHRVEGTGTAALPSSDAGRGEGDARGGGGAIHAKHRVEGTGAAGGPDLPSDAGRGKGNAAAATRRAGTPPDDLGRPDGSGSRAGGADDRPGAESRGGRTDGAGSECEGEGGDADAQYVIPTAEVVDAVEAVVGETEAVRRDRIRLGLCPGCGTQLFEVRRGSVMTGRREVLVPVTEPGVVRRGRCLSCHPRDDGDIPDVDAAEDDGKGRTWPRRHIRKLVLLTFAMVVAVVSVSVVTATRTRPTPKPTTKPTPQPTWGFTPEEARYYEFRTLRNINYCLNVEGGSNEDFTKIQLWQCDGTAAQLFYFDSDWKLHSRLNNVCMEMDPDPDMGVFVHSACHDKWRVEGPFIRNVGDDMCLVVNWNEDIRNGTAITRGGCGGAYNQNAEFSLYTYGPEADLQGDGYYVNACVFPFVVGGRTFTECTGLNNGGVPWCSLETTTGDMHVDDQWGNCQPHIDGV